ncbi:hypothetical protein Q9L58_009752 [Maublancomyces gigas]|uniref:Uncharacterized protein n=1 Tax=Discina gigas TaxID=1032678 RepID=A0ABR3G613_9PEZI
MELINDRKRLLRLAIVFQLDLEDFILNLKCNESAADNETARSEFVQGVAHFLKQAMVTPPTVPATKSPVVNPKIRIPRSAPAAILGTTKPAVELVVDALSQSMATTHLPDEDDDIPSDSDTDVSTSGYSITSTVTHASAISTTGNSTHGNARKVVADAVRSKSSGSGPPVTSNKRGRECNKDCDDDEEEEGELESGDEEGEEGEETEVDEGEDDDDKGKKAEGKKVGAGGRKHRKMAHHNCKIPCGESMRIDE